jgi:titin
LYDFQVAAANVVGTGQPSTPATASTYNVPDTPTDLLAQPGLNSVNLSWKPPASDGGTPITSYTVQGRVSGTNPTSQWHSVTTIPSPISGSTINCVVTQINSNSLSNGTLYDFRVAAVNVVDPGQYSAPARESTFNVPDSPTGLIAQSGVRIVTLLWNPPASDGGTPIISYTVQHRPSAPPNQSWITTPNANPIVLLPPLNYNDPVTLQYIVTGLINATQYDFQVTAVNASGTCLPSAIATASTYAAPGAPTGLTAQSDVKSVHLTWLPPLSDGGTPITSYTVRVNGNTANTIPTSIPLTPVPLHCIVNGYVIDPNNPNIFQVLNDGTLYTFYIAAVNAVGVGAYASITKSTDALPDAPISLMGTPCDAKVILYWTSPTNDGGAPIINYLVEFKLAASSAAWSPFGHAPSRTMVVTGLTNGSFYDFRVSAITAVGTGPPSNIFETMPTEKFVPGPPPWSRAGGNNCPNCDSNYGTSACGNAIPPYSTYALDERRKAEILKYNGNSAQMSKAQQYSMASRNALTRKKSWATQTQTYTNPNVDNLPESQIPINGVLRTVSLQCRNQPAIRCSLTSGSDVPGPVIALCFNAQIPLYNYKPQFTYPSGGEKQF